MTTQEKTTLVVQTIFDELKGQQSGHLKLTIANNDSLNGKISKTELEDILKNLQCKEHILEVLPNQTNKKIKDYDFAIHVAPTFENWYSAYLLAKGRKLTDLDDPLIQDIYHLTLDIASELQIHSTPDIAVLQESAKKFESLENSEAISTSSEVRKRRLDSIDFLESIGIISIREIRVYGSDGTGDDRVDIKVNIIKFEQFKREIEKIYSERLNKEKSTSKAIMKTSSQTITEASSEASSDAQKKSHPNGTLYQLSYNAFTKQVVLNENVVLATPDFDGENEAVFQYLLKNPDKKIRKNDLQSALKRPLKKDFDKILENLGFIGDLRKAFFDYRKDTILLRNPLTKSTVDEIGIKLPLKIPKNNAVLPFKTVTI